ncbi:MAG: hypothetical protein HQM10_19610 [Candidatus Riflebacteria bacterium]|nr:hypothetical protein [Candidatus Riflebacteria bacterium]
MHDMFVRSPQLLLFTILGAGYFLGKIKLFNFNLNVAAVLFVGLAFGIWDGKNFKIPDELFMLGLILFVYSLGLQSGPSFFSSFREKGLKFNLASIFALLFSFFVALFVGNVLKIPREILAGIYSGSLTNTAALAAVTERIFNTFPSGTPVEKITDMTIAPVIGYSICYPFGVIGAMLAMYIFSSIFRKNLQEEIAEYNNKLASGKTKKIAEFRILNEQVFEKSLGELKIAEMSEMLFTRIRHEWDISLVNNDTILHRGDILVGRGSDEAIKKASLILGPVVEEKLTEITPSIQHGEFIINNREIIGKSVLEFNAECRYGAVVTRVKRAYTDLAIDQKTTLEFGDRIRVVKYSDSDQTLISIFGNQDVDLSETDYLSVSLGIISGILLGMIPIPISSESSISLGFAGGPLVAALFLGYLGRTGPIIWTIPTNANLTLRQLGLHLFMAGIGLKAGSQIVLYFNLNGLYFFTAGTLITLSTSLSLLFIGRQFLKLGIIDLLGLTAGIHQPACLAYARQLSSSDAPNLPYTAIQPVTMIAKILLAQAILF